MAVYGLESLQGLQLQVDQEVNLLQDLTIADGLTLQKVEVERDGGRTEIADAGHYVPDFPGTINIILTIVKPDGSLIEAKVENLTVKGLEYQSVSINNIKPDEVFPQITQIEA